MLLLTIYAYDAPYGDAEAFAIFVKKKTCSLSANSMPTRLKYLFFLALTISPILVSKIVSRQLHVSIGLCVKFVWKLNGILRKLENKKLSFGEIESVCANSINEEALLDKGRIPT